MEHFFAAVVAAFGANVVAADHRSAMGASDEAGGFELEVGATESFTGFGDSSLWDCHGFILLFGRTNYRQGEATFKRNFETMSK